MRKQEFLWLIFTYHEENYWKGNYNPGQNIWNKIQKHSKNWTGRENFDIYFCVFFDCYVRELISGRRNGRQAMSPSKFEIFQIFSYFPRYQVLSRQASHESTRIPSLLYQILRFVLLVVEDTINPLLLLAEKCQFFI